MRIKTATPQSVSRALRRAGFAPVARHSRDGLSVFHGATLDSVTVAAMIVGDARGEIAMIADAAEALREAGYTVEPWQEGAFLTVWRPTQK